MVTANRHRYKRLFLRAASFVLLASLLGCASFWHDGFAAVFSGGPSAKSPDRAEAFGRFLAATVYERHGQYDKASAELDRAAACSPDSPTLTLRQIRTHLRNNNYESALAAAERAVQQLPGNANLWVVLGEIQHHLKQDEKAVESFQKAVAIDPENVMGLGALVTVEESTNDYVAAADIYKKLAQMSPDSSAVQFQLGLSLARINEAEGARAALKRALELRPDLARAHYMLGIMDMESGDNAAAEKHLAIYVKDSPDDVRARENLAGALGRLKRYPEAADALAPILAGDKTEPRHHVEAAYILLRAGRFKEAEEVIPAEGAPAFGAILRALARKGTGEPHLPIIETLDAIETDIGAECTNFLNELLYLFGKNDTADFFTSELGEIRNQGVHSKTLDIVYARVLMGVDREDEAEKVLLDALNRGGSDKALHYCLSVIYEGSDRLDEAEKQLKEYLKLDPDNPEVLNFLGYMYADHNIKLDEAEALLKKALAIDPDNAFYLDSLGWVYYHRGDADRAIECIKKAILTMEQDDAELRNHLGDAYLLKGDTDKALAEWKRAQRLDPKLKGVKEKIDQHEKAAPTN